MDVDLLFRLGRDPPDRRPSDNRPATVAAEGVDTSWGKHRLRQALLAAQGVRSRLLSAVRRLG